MKKTRQNVQREGRFLAAVSAEVSRAMASVDLSSSVIDLDGVRDDAAAALVACLESRPGRKALVLDPHVGPTVMRVATMATLRAHDVDRLYYLEGGTLETTCSEVMFVVRPRLELMHKLAEVVASVRDDEAERRARRAKNKNAREKERGDNVHDDDDEKTVRFTACFLPRRSEACEAVLKHLGVLPFLKIKSLPIDLVPFERDAALVECKRAWRDLAVERDVSSLYDVARALHELQRRVGEVPIVQGKGAASKEVAEIMERLRREQAAEDARARDEWPRDAGRGFTKKKRDGDASAADVSDDAESDDTAESSDASSSSSSSDSDASPFSGSRADWGMDFGGLPIGPREYWDVSSSRRWRRRCRNPNRRLRSKAPRARAEAFLGTEGAPQIDMLVLIDRDVDMVTPLCTQTTYEGLLDEVLGISATGTVSFETNEEEEGNEGTGGRKKKITRARLDSSDALFSELRDLNFGRACETLRAKSFAMQSEYRDMRGFGSETENDVGANERASQMSVSDIGGFVRKMRAAVTPGAGLELHTKLAERALASTKGDAYFRRVRFAEVLDTERLCLGHGGGVFPAGAALQGLQEGLQDALRITADGVGGSGGSGAANAVCARLESMLFRGENVRRAARILALLCLTHAGIPRKQYDALRREFVHAYGPPAILLLQRMEEAGIAFAREDERDARGAAGEPHLTSGELASGGSGGAAKELREKNKTATERHRRRKTAYANVRRSMRLVVDDLDDTDPDDIAYAYSHSGYAPLSVRLILAAVQSGWRHKSVEDALRHLPGPHFEYAQGRDFDDVSSAAGPGAPVVEPSPKRDWFDAKLQSAKRLETRREKNATDQKEGFVKRPVVLAFFVGGVTRAEISCLRFASRTMRVGCDFVVGATSVVNGNGLIESLMDDARVFEPLDALDVLEVQRGGGKSDVGAAY